MTSNFLVSTDSLHLSERIPETVGNINNPLTQFHYDGLLPLNSLEQSRSDSRFLRSSVASTINRKKNFANSRKFQRNSNKEAILKKNLSLDRNFYAISKDKAVANKLIRMHKEKQFFKDHSNLNEYHFRVLNDLACDKNELNKKSFEGKKENIFRCLIHREFAFINSIQIIIYSILNELNFILKTLIGVFRLIDKKIILFDANSPFKIIWDSFIMIIVLIQLFIYSIEKTFYLKLELNSFCIALNNCLFLNILFILNTNFYSEGSQVTHRKKILQNFVKRHILIDVVPCICLFISNLYLESNKFHDLNIFLCLPMLNLNQIGRRIEEFIGFDNKLHHLYRVFILIMKIVLLGHFLGCMWHFIGCISLETENEEENWLKSYGIENKAWNTRYVYSIYWAVTTMLTVGYGDITPSNEKEVLFNIFSMFLGCGMFGYTMNCIGEILKESGEKNQILKSKINQLKNIMKNRKLPLDLQIKIKKYLEFVWVQEMRENPEDEKNIMMKLSTNLRNQFLHHSYVKSLRAIPLFSKFTKKTLISLASKMKKVGFSPEEPVYRKGELDDLALYFVLEGKLELFKENEHIQKAKSTKLKVYKPGDYFGVNETITGKARSCSVISLDFSSLLKLTQADLLNVLQKDIGNGDFEKFCHCKDQEIIYGLQIQYNIPCESCGHLNHKLEDCKFFSYNPNKFTVIGKFLEEQKKRAMKFKRKRTRTKTPLQKKFLYEESALDFLEIYKNDEDLKELIQFYEFLAKEKELDVSHDRQLSPLEKKNNPENNIEKTETLRLMEEDGSKERKKEDFPSGKCWKKEEYRSAKFLQVSSNNSSKLSGYLSAQKVPTTKNKSVLENQVSIDESNFIRVDKEQNYLVFQKTDCINSFKSLKQVNLDCDKVKSFRFYFNKNNVQNIINVINKNLVDI